MYHIKYLKNVSPIMWLSSIWISPLEALWKSLVDFSLKRSEFLEQIPRKSEGILNVVDSRTGHSYKLPIVNNAVKATDFRQISVPELSDGALERYVKGLKVLDPGFQNTAVVESSVTYTDAILGKIQYRQYTLDYLIEHHDFEDVAFLIIWSHLPSRDEKFSFRRRLVQASKPPAAVLQTINSFSPEAPSFLIVTAAFAAWSASDPSKIPQSSGGNLYVGNLEAVDDAVIRAIGAASSVAALVSCYKQGCQFTPPDPEKSFVANQLLMLGASRSSNGIPDAQVEKVLSKLWILYADHEMTNSTAAFLHVTSTLADPFSGIIGAIVSGSGPLHIGAIDLAYKSFESVGSMANVPALIADVKAKKCRLFGYGHRVYKTVDPRVKFLRHMIDDLQSEKQKTESGTGEKNSSDSLLEIALEIDRIARQDKYFTSRNLNANADLYGCFVFSALGIQPEVIATMAGVSRVSGFMAHWREQMCDKPNIWRPTQVFRGDVVQ